MLLAGEATSYRHDTDREAVFRQESNFYYLSGCTVPSSFLLAAYQAGASELLSLELFIPKAEPADIMWSIPPPSLEAAKQAHDVTSVDYPSALTGAIKTLVEAYPDALFHVLPRNSPLFPVLPEDYVNLVLSHENGAVTDLYLLSALHRARLIQARCRDRGHKTCQWHKFKST